MPFGDNSVPKAPGTALKKRRVLSENLRPRFTCLSTLCNSKRRRELSRLTPTLGMNDRRSAIRGRRIRSQKQGAAWIATAISQPISFACPRSPFAANKRVEVDAVWALAWQRCNPFLLYCQIDSSVGAWLFTFVQRAASFRMRSRISRGLSG